MPHLRHHLHIHKNKLLVENFEKKENLRTLFFPNSQLALPGTLRCIFARGSARRRCPAAGAHHVAACPRTPVRSSPVPPRCRRSLLPTACQLGARRELGTAAIQDCFGKPAFCLPSRRYPLPLPSEKWVGRCHKILGTPMKMGTRGPHSPGRMGTPLGKWGPLLSDFRECPVKRHLDLSHHSSIPVYESE